MSPSTRNAILPGNPRPAQGTDPVEKRIVDSPRSPFCRAGLGSFCRHSTIPCAVHRFERPAGRDLQPGYGHLPGRRQPDRLDQHDFSQRLKDQFLALRRSPVRPEVTAGVREGSAGFAMSGPASAPHSMRIDSAAPHLPAPASCGRFPTKWTARRVTPSARPIQPGPFATAFRPGPASRSQADCSETARPAAVPSGLGKRLFARGHGQCQGGFNGTATQNDDQICYSSVFAPSGLLRQPVNPAFATTPDVPAAGFSLYRISVGHGGLQCESCQGSTRAEYRSSHANYNFRSVRLQGHIGAPAECSTCHSQTPRAVTGGPHGIHPVGQSRVFRQGGRAERNAAQCRTCHGLDYRGTELCRVAANHAFRAGDSGSRSFAAGTRTGCNDGDNGPRGD